MPDQLTLHTPRLQMRILTEAYAAAVLDYYKRNRAFHQPWFAARPESVFTPNQQKINLSAEHADFLAGRAVPFWLFLQTEPERIIGRIAFTQIIHGCFDSCFVAYHLDQDAQGSGLAQEAGEAAIPILFKDFGLHRIEANIMPANHRSISLAERLGFSLEGLSSRYLKINGQWEDHLHYTRLADEKPSQTEAPILETGFIQLRQLNPDDVPAAFDYVQRNREHIYTWNPMPAEDIGSLSGWQRIMAASRREQAAGRRLDFGIFLKDRPQKMVGLIECREIKPLPFSSCEIGFSIDHLLAGRGLMLDALSLVISYIIPRFGLQRITANCCSDHERSIRLLSLLGFRQEGLAKKSIYLQDSWKDLIEMALLKDDFRAINSLET